MSLGPTRGFASARPFAAAASAAEQRADEPSGVLANPSAALAAEPLADVATDLGADLADHVAADQQANTEPMLAPASTAPPLAMTVPTIASPPQRC